VEEILPTSKTMKYPISVMLIVLKDSNTFKAGHSALAMGKCKESWEWVCLATMMQVREEAKYLPKLCYIVE
jgi:hypothetical protein